MMVFERKLLLLVAGVVWLGSMEVSCIISKSVGGPEENEVTKGENVGEQSIKRDFVAGYEETGYGHGGYGLSGHSNYGFPEGHEGYAVLEGGKHYVHYPEDHHHYHHQQQQQQHEQHKHYDLGYHKALAIKSLLVPLAGVALLGAAAAFVSNPILLQLGVISGSSLGRRKRHITPSASHQRHHLEDITLLRTFIHQIPDQKIQSQEKRMVAEYLSCSSMSKRNLCLERLACELHSREGATMAMEANVFTIALKQILDNEFVAEDMKIRLKKAIDSGNNNFNCTLFQCDLMDKETATP